MYIYYPNKLQRLLNKMFSLTLLINHIFGVRNRLHHGKDRLFSDLSRAALVAMLVCSSLPATLLANDDTNNYRLGGLDTISIVVFQEDDLSLTAKIDTDGYITYPLLGKIKFGGMTVSEATEKLHSLLVDDYLVNPRISISVASYRPFYISGEVRNPGSYEYQPNMTVRQAITIAGDFTDRASRSKVYLTREKDSTFTPIKVGLDTKISPGDSISVKESLF